MKLNGDPHNIAGYVDTYKKIEPNILLDLGMMYSLGKAVNPDKVMAHKYFNLAAMSGLGEALRYRKEVASEMEQEEIVEAQRQAREWLSEHVIN